MFRSARIQRGPLPLGPRAAVLRKNGRVKHCDYSLFHASIFSSAGAADVPFMTFFACSASHQYSHADQVKHDSSLFTNSSLRTSPFVFRAAGTPVTVPKHQVTDNLINSYSASVQFFQNTDGRHISDIPSVQRYVTSRLHSCIRPSSNKPDIRHSSAENASIADAFGACLNTRKCVSCEESIPIGGAAFSKAAT